MDDDLKEIFKELAKSQKELSESQKELSESQKRTDTRLEKTMAKVDKIAEMYGGVGNSQGKVAEEFFYNSLKHNPVLDGIRFEYIDKNITRSRNNIEEEYDIVLVNGALVYIIEVKYRLRKEDIDRYVTRKLPNFKIIFPEYKDFDIRLAFASFFIEDELVEYAREKGFLILKRRGKVFDALAA